jgi:fibro-slime domain-containing protein
MTSPPGNEFVAPKEPKRNFNFCVESHASFIYVKGQKFHINGDDDLWIFINDKLVVDRGGIHPPVSDSVLLDTMGLNQGMDYSWDMFQCDRQPCASTLRLSTNIFLKQKWPLNWDLKTASNGVQKIQFSKIIGASEKCAMRVPTRPNIPRLHRKLAPRAMRHKTGALPNALGRRVKAKVLPRTL